LANHTVQKSRTISKIGVITKLPEQYKNTECSQVMDMCIQNIFH